MPPRPPVPRIVQYAPVEITPHRDLYHRNGRHGPPPAEAWPLTYLQQLTAHGKGWLAAKQAGVAYKTVQRLRAADPLFAEHEADARREFIESLEQNLDRIGQGDDMPAVTATIVRLKKEDPAGYVEKNLSVSLSVSTELDPAAGQHLLAAILSPHTPQPALPEASA